MHIILFQYLTKLSWGGKCMVECGVKFGFKITIHCRYLNLGKHKTYALIEASRVCMP